MKKNLNEKINKTNDPTHILIDEDNIIYWCDYAIYGKRKIPSKDRIKFEDKVFQITNENESERMQGVFICSFHACGHGFFLESKYFAESLQIYKATNNRDYYFTVNEVTDKKIRDTKSYETVFNKKELLSFLPEYFDGIKSLFVTGYNDSIVDSFYEFLK